MILGFYGIRATRPEVKAVTHIGFSLRGASLILERRVLRRVSYCYRLRLLSAIQQALVWALTGSILSLTSGGTAPVRVSDRVCRVE